MGQNNNLIIIVIIISSHKTGILAPIADLILNINFNIKDVEKIFSILINLLESWENFGGLKLLFLII